MGPRKVPDETTNEWIARERQRYVRGEIDIAEFEDRVERILDETRAPPLSSMRFQSIPV